MSDILDLNNTEWDCCIIGNGVSSLWLSHWLWSAKKSVLWITSEQPYSPERAMLQHAWLWGVTPEDARFLQDHLQGFGQVGVNVENESTPLELIYFDAKSSKRFRRLTEIKQEWGEAEKDYFNSLLLKPELVDLWQWHAKLHSFHDTTEANSPTAVELFTTPRFVRVQGLQINELQTSSKKLLGLTLSWLKPDNLISIKARQFYLGDFDEYLPALIQDKDDSVALASALKGRSYRSGFGLRFWHKKETTKLEAVPIIPLLVNPTEKNTHSHTVGRFIESATHGLQSFWIGFLTDEEVEDNHEILKKIKQAKRAIDRAVPGFVESILREAITFEPKAQQAVDLMKDRSTEVLGARLISDYSGLKATIDAFKKIFEKEKQGEDLQKPCNLG